MSVEVTGGREWMASLTKAASKAIPEAEKVVTKGALNIKTDWRLRWSGHPHIKALPYAIGFDVYPTFGGNIEAEIGVDKGRRQGPLANIIAFGSPTSAPIPGPLEALATEGPKFEKALADLGESLLS